MMSMLRSVYIMCLYSFRKDMALITTAQQTGGLKVPNGHPLSRSVSVSKAPLNSSPMMRAMWFLSTSMLMYHDLLNHGLRFHENSLWGLC